MKIVVLDGYAANPGDLSWDEQKLRISSHALPVSGFLFRYQSRPVSRHGFYIGKKTDDILIAVLHKSTGKGVRSTFWQ